MNSCIFERVNRIDWRVPPTGVHYVICATTHATCIPSVIQIERERRVYTDRGMKRRRRLPSSITHARDELPLRRGGP